MSNMSYKLLKDYQLDNFSENINQNRNYKDDIISERAKRKKEREKSDKILKEIKSHWLNDRN